MDTTRKIGHRKFRKKERRRSAKTGRDSHHPGVQSGYVKSFDGTRIFYSVEGKGAPLVFCYGIVCSSLHWTYQIEHFRKSHQSIWFDYRGHHNSDTPKDLRSLTLKSAALDLGVVLDEIGIKEAVLLGHSMGVNVVLEFYRQQPDRVKAMVLANGTSRRPLHTMFRNPTFHYVFPWLRKIHKKAPRLIESAWKNQHRNPIAKAILTYGGFNPHLTPQSDIETYAKMMSEIDPAVFLQFMKDYDTIDASSWLHQVDVPTLIIAGEKDHITPIEQQEKLHQLIPSSQLEVIPSGSHCSQMDLPELTNKKIEKFLKQLERA